MAQLEHRWERELAGVEFAVAEVPPARSGGGAEHVLLARTLGPSGPSPARIVVYRRPLEARAADPQELQALVHDVIVEEVADLLGLAPDTVDPSYGTEPDDPF